MKAIAIWNAQKQKEDALRELIKIKKRLQDYVDTLSDIRLPKYTGWFVLLSKDGDSKSGYKFVGFFNPDVCEESEEPEWDVAIPIATKESINEFLGW